MVDFKIQAKAGFDALSSSERELQTFDQFIEQEFTKLLDTIVADAKGNIQDNMSVVTGELLSSIKTFEQDGLTGTVGSDAEYAEFVEYGRGPVKPINAKVLHWVDKFTGEDVFASYAGPADPRPFMEPAIESNVDEFPDIVVKKLNEKFD